MKVQCNFCDKKFHKKGLAAHQRSCKKKQEQSRAPQNRAYQVDQIVDAGGAQTQTPVVDVKQREAKAYRRGLLQAVQEILETLRVYGD